MNNQSLSRSLAALTAVLTATACAPESEKSAWDYLATSPSSVTPYQQGKRDLAAGNYGLALEHFNAAVMQNPSSAPAWNGQAIALAKLDRDDEATAAFEKAMAIDANAPVTLSNYANFLERRGYHVKATTLLAKMDPAASAPGTAAAPAAVPATKTPGIVVWPGFSSALGSAT